MTHDKMNFALHMFLLLPFVELATPYINIQKFKSSLPSCLGSNWVRLGDQGTDINLCFALSFQDLRQKTAFTNLGECYGEAVDGDDPTVVVSGADVQGTFSRCFERSCETNLYIDYPCVFYYVTTT